MPPGLLAVSVLIFITVGFGPNIGLALAAIIELVVVAILLWRPGESPILLLIFCFQWLQASVAIFSANWLDLDLVHYETIRGSTELAVFITLLALAALAIGMRLGAGSPNPSYALQIYSTSRASPLEKWFWLYVFSAGAAFAALAFAYVVPGLTQPLMALAGLKWAFFFCFAYTVFVKDKGRRLFALAFMLELAEGFGRFFSDFKTVLIVTLCAGVSSRVRISLIPLISLGAVAALGLGLGIVWTAIKPEYRSYVSGASHTQNVVTSYSDNIKKLYELSTNLDGHAVGSAVDGLLRRMSYVEFFSVVLDVVPEYMPYERGKIWLDAVSRPFLPRLLFGDKESINDTTRTNLYTRGLVANAGEASISIGYVAESYIDFGYFGMMIVILAYGYVCGWIYRRFLTWKASRGVLGMGISTGSLTAGNGSGKQHY